MDIFQFGLESNPFSVLISFAMLVVFFMFYPRLMLSQIMWKLEKTVKDLEEMSDSAKEFVLKEINPKPEKKTREAVNRFFEFFMIAPVSLDPYGIVKKVEHMIEGQRERFSYFVKQTAPKLGEEKQANIEMGLAGGITLHEIAKVVKHYVEIVKKTKSFQIAMILQMQLPLVESMSKSIYKGTKAMAQGRPIGDAAGPYFVAKMAGNEKYSSFGDDIVLVRKDIKGRDAFLLKARGPGGRLGRPGLAVHQIAKQHKIVKIISIDAAAKMEGERTGDVAEGIGVAMGGIGVERNYIEEVAVKSGIPLDSIIVKMSSEEAIEPLRKSIIDAYPQIMEALERSLETVKKDGKVVIVGVGNTSGVGNNAKEIKQAEELAEKWEKHLNAKKKKKKGKQEVEDGWAG